MKKDIKSTKRLSAELILSVSFLIMISIPMVVSIYEPDQESSHDEKRQLNVWPQYDETVSIVEYFNDISEYVKDHFGFRSELIKVYNRLKLTLGESPTENTVIGKGGWLFYKTQDPLSSLSNDQEQVIKNLTDRVDQVVKLKKQLASMGVGYRYLIAPNKMSIYPELLPKKFQMVAIDATFKLFKQKLNKADSSILFDAHNVLLASKSTAPTRLYFKHDSHWNSIGAYTVAKELSSDLSKQFPKLEFEKISHTFEINKKHGGDLATYIGLRKALIHLEPFVVLPRCTRKSYSIEIRKGVFKNQCEKNQTKMLLIGDSFMGELNPFLAESIGSLTIAKQGMNYQQIIDLVKEFKPDILIEELVERNIAEPLSK